MAESININDVPVLQNPTANTKLVGVENGQWAQVPASSLGGNTEPGIVIPTLTLQIVKEDVSSLMHPNIGRPRGAIVVRLNYPANAAFLQHNPRIVMLRQSGNRAAGRGKKSDGTFKFYRMKSKKFAYTRRREFLNNKWIEHRYWEFPFGSPDMQHLNEDLHEFCLMNPGSPEFYFTPQMYCEYFCSTIAPGNGIFFEHLRRGGLKPNKMQHGGTSGYSYASAIIGFQLMTDAGRSNIVFVKLKLINQASDSTYIFNKSWSILP